MKTMIVLIAVLWSVVLVSEPALAGCTTQTILLPDGRMMICTVCQGITTCH